MATKTHPKPFKFKSDIEVLPISPMKPSELAARYPAMEIAKHGGGSLRSYGGSCSRVEIDYEPNREGFIWLSVDGRRALVHKDELLYFARFAKGHTAI